MKVLKWLVVVLFVLLLGVLGVGLASSEFSYTNEVAIRKPAADVWQVFTDAGRMKEWLEGLETVECVSGKPLQVGSEWKLVFEEKGDPIEVFEKVTAVDAPRRYAFDMETEPFTGKTDITLEERSGITILRATSRVAGRNVLWCSVLRLSSPMLKSQSQACYEKLRELIEKPS